MSSMRMVKNGDGIVLPNSGEVLLELIVTRSGVQLKSPLPPNEVCKLLNNIGIDLMYQSLQQVEATRVHMPV